VEEQDGHDIGLASRLGFNGATAMKPWKRFVFEGGKWRNGALQWGHGDEAVEERNFYLDHHWNRLASMGPRR